MTRRLALVIVGAVIATLLLAGAGTIALSAVRARTSTVHDTRDHATQIAANIDELLDIDTAGVAGTPEGDRQLRIRMRVLNTFRNVMPVDELVVLVADNKGVLQGDPLPAPITMDDIDPTAMAAGTVVSGSHGRTAYAAAPTRSPNGKLIVVVATRQIDAGLGPAVTLFLWASAATIVLGLLAAFLLGRHLSRPLRDATAATQRIAAGDLGARVPSPPAHRRDELTDLARNINGMAEALERSRTLEQQFLLSVSHDLRTPLTSIRGYAEAIADGAGDPARAAGVIKSESRRLERLVADLLDLAKLQAKAFTFAMQPLDLSAAVHTATEGVSGARPGITFHPVTTGPLVVPADPDRLGQVLANLVENAGKYATAKVIVSARAEGQWAVVTVDDDGPGIPEHDRPHVFERLYVARHAPERRENASGLGLAIVRELVTAMGGQVTAGAAPGGGARLSFRLPMAG